MAQLQRADQEGWPHRRLGSLQLHGKLPNVLTASINRERSPVLLATLAEHDAWLNGTPEEAFALVRPFPAERLEKKQGLLRA